MRRLKALPAKASFLPLTWRLNVKNFLLGLTKPLQLWYYTLEVR